MLLLDTDVMIDVLRGHDVALEWLQSLADETIGLPGFVAMELLQGCRNRQEQQRVRRTLRPFALHWPNEHDCTRAYDDFAAFWLSHKGASLKMHILCGHRHRGILERSNRLSRT